MQAFNSKIFVCYAAKVLLPRETIRHALILKMISIALDMDLILKRD